MTRAEWDAMLDSLWDDLRDEAGAVQIDRHRQVRRMGFQTALPPSCGIWGL